MLYALHNDRQRFTEKPAFEVGREKSLTGALIQADIWTQEEIDLADFCEWMRKVTPPEIAAGLKLVDPTTGNPCATYQIEINRGRFLRLIQWVGVRDDDESLSPLAPGEMLDQRLGHTASFRVEMRIKSRSLTAEAMSGVISSQLPIIFERIAEGEETGETKNHAYTFSWTAGKPSTSPDIPGDTREDYQTLLI